MWCDRQFDRLLKEVDRWRRARGDPTVDPDAALSKFAKNPRYDGISLAI